MATDYDQLKWENIRRYGEDIGRIGPMLLAHRYDDRTHFIFELLQNAEDALRRRSEPAKSKSVRFQLTPTGLLFTHFGHPFTDRDVRGICGIAESNKQDDLSAIGRFGIGFKAVYAFTDSPEIHSGDEHFAIDSFVWPRRIDSMAVGEGGTLFRFPFRTDDRTAHSEIASSLSQLNLRTLLFLREIEEIEWQIEDGHSGTYLRETREINSAVREVTLLGQPFGQKDIQEEHWLVFHRPVVSPTNQPAGEVEAAFQLSHTSPRRIERVENATLSVFFPTIVSVHFGVVLQGPYRTTPSRDNIPRNDPWNQHLIAETASLLPFALHRLKEMELLDASTLQALPIHTMRFAEKELFRPLYEATAQALKNEDLLPCHGGGHVPGSKTKIGRTKEVRELFSPVQLGALFGNAEPLFWVTEEVTRDKTPELRQYLMAELGIGESEPDTIASKVTEAFLVAQDDAWMSSFYAFLRDKEQLWRSGGLREKPIIRLEDGRHVRPFVGNQPQAFLPGSYTSGFHVVRAAICEKVEALDFLKKLGLSEPDPVDDVTVNLLPKYRQPNFSHSETEYAADFQCILTAFKADSKTQREKLLAALRQTPFVAVVDAGTGARSLVKPTLAYQSTERLKALFAGISGILMVDSTFGGLKGEAARDLLEASGCAEYLASEVAKTEFSGQELREMRQKAGCENNSGGNQVEDQTLRGLQAVLDYIPSLPLDQANDRARLLWEAICDVEDRRGTGIFTGTYRWFYFQSRSCQFDAAFLRKLNTTAWVPGRNGVLELPRFVVFEDLSSIWRDNAFLRSKVIFKPRLEAELAAQAGIEPGVLDLLKKLGVTSEADLKKRLGIPEELSKTTKVEIKEMTAKNAIAGLLGDSPEPTSPAGGGDSEIAPGAVTRKGGGNGVGGSSGGGAGKHPSGDGPAKLQFHTYVSVSTEPHTDDEEKLPDHERIELEKAAIAFIRQKEPGLRATPTNNPGFDLFEGESLEAPSRFVEVKSKKGAWAGSVALTDEQFRKAACEGDRYWLYVVEFAGDPEKTLVNRIQNPAGKARYFTFDSGWQKVAKMCLPVDRKNINPLGE